ncbi:MAG: hypothetical protein ABL963_09695 [Longimicrobiales bacterium]
MEHRISATELARGLGDALGRVRYRGDSFLVEKNGEPVARLEPIVGASAATVAEGLRAWMGTGGSDPGFADDLERIGAAHPIPDDAWGS